MNYLPRISSAIAFAMMTLFFGVLAAWLLHNNYVNDEALYNWAAVRSLFDADTFRLENLGFDYPHGPVLALTPLYLLPWFKSASPFVLSAGTTALLLTLWLRHLSQLNYSFLQRAILMALMIANPAVLWCATSGGSEALALLMFYLLYRNCLRLVYNQDIRSFIALGLVLAAFFYFEAISLYLFVALLPLLMFIVPNRQLRATPLSVYIIIGVPLLVMAASWIYFNWIFLGEPLAFLNTYQSAFTGAMAHAETLPWLRAHGGQLIVPMLLGFAYIAIGYPVLPFLMWRTRTAGRPLHISLVLMFYPVISIGVATYTYFLASPLQITTLIIAGVMAEVERMGGYKWRSLAPLLVFLSAGIASSWYLFTQDTNAQTRPWLDALQSHQLKQHYGDTRVGHWLAANRKPTMMDLQSGFRAIAARGDAAGLLLPFTPEYRLAMRSDHPFVSQIALPDPDTNSGKRDSINLRFPFLYESGMPGYERVYDENGWRVYRRVY